MRRSKHPPHHFEIIANEIVTSFPDWVILETGSTQCRVVICCHLGLWNGKKCHGVAVSGVLFLFVLTDQKCGCSGTVYSCLGGRNTCPCTEKPLLRFQKKIVSH